MQKKSTNAESVDRIIKELDPDLTRCHHNPDYYVPKQFCNFSREEDCWGPVCETLEEEIERENNDSKID